MQTKKLTTAATKIAFRHLFFCLSIQTRIQKKEGRRTLLRCSGLFSLDRFIRMEDFSV